MRFFYVIFFIFLFSCSPDSEISNESEFVTQHRQNASTRKAEPHPAYNPLNPYEYSGQLFDSLFTAYFDSEDLPITTAAIVMRVNKVAEENSHFVSLKSTFYAPVITDDVDALLNNPQNCVSDFINASALSAHGRIRMESFINGVVGVCNAATEYQAIYDYIAAFESSTLQASDLTTYDKEVMLITSSISRYSAYRKRKKPKKKEDPEWDLLMTHVTAGAQGAEIGVCESTARALATGVAGKP